MSAIAEAEYEPVIDASPAERAARKERVIERLARAMACRYGLDPDAKWMRGIPPMMPFGGYLMPPDCVVGPVWVAFYDSAVAAVVFYEAAGLEYPIEPA